MLTQAGGHEGDVHPQDRHCQVVADPVERVLRGVDILVRLVGPFDGKHGGSCRWMNGTWSLLNGLREVSPPGRV